MKRRIRSQADQRGDVSWGFTIVELLVSIAVLLIVMAVMLQVTGGVGEIWKSSTGKISAFQSARSAFSTVSRTLSQATLNTYNDYVDSQGAVRTASNSASFLPSRFARASELHFISGPSTEVIPGANANTSPGHAVLFQAPLGFTDNQLGLASLNRTVNSVGFYVQYARTDSALLPGWMQPLFGSDYRFRLMQVIEPTERMKVYDSTANGNYDTDWTSSFGLTGGGNQTRSRVLAEDVCLLVLRPRLSPPDETTIASELGLPANPSAPGGILSPDYRYNSRAWETGYNGPISVPKRRDLMRNQIPPIIDVAMVSVDRRSMLRFDSKGSTPPAIFNVPSSLFQDASSFDADLNTYSKQLSDAGIRHRVFRTSVDLQGAKWSSTL